MGKWAKLNRFHVGQKFQDRFYGAWLSLPFSRPRNEYNFVSDKSRPQMSSGSLGHLSFVPDPGLQGLGGVRLVSVSRTCTGRCFEHSVRHIVGWRELSEVRLRSSLVEDVSASQGQRRDGKEKEV